ncbi:hypothetical protein NDU88_006331 [Pleurodeles waltl]|uniref:Uncharacterized protein n=1 Tax=Pleurodeles waltl TaxID=8319 RepID=A0AAV7SPA6_PLEWA|nr:hypothetical protein NDU88_006331 [Pleurodeles waltl]
MEKSCCQAPVLLRDTSTRKHSPSHSRAGPPHQTTLRATTEAAMHTSDRRCPAREISTRGTVTSTEEKDNAPLNHAKEERKVSLNGD